MSQVILLKDLDRSLVQGVGGSRAGGLFSFFFFNTAWDSG